MTRKLHYMEVGGAGRGKMPFSMPISPAQCTQTNYMEVGGGEVGGARWVEQNGRSRRAAALVILTCTSCNAGRSVAGGRPPAHSETSQPRPTPSLCAVARSPARAAAVLLPSPSRWSPVLRYQFCSAPPALGSGGFCGPEARRL